jgi:uncharacterized protein (AIM24 family)
MDISFDKAESRKQLATIALEQEESVCVLHPNQIIAFQAESSKRVDSFMKLPGMYRKKRFVQSTIHGPARFMLGLPEGFYLSTIPIELDDDLLYEFKHVLFYKMGITFRTHVQTVRNAMVTRDFIRMRFQGPGTLGLLTSGPLHEVELHPEKPLYVDTACLVAYPQKANIRLCVYGNTLASQNMNYHWEMTGTGRVLLQPSKPDRGLNDQMQQDGFIRRVLREVIPFGGIFIK